jgi:hypothetical protein
MDYSSIAQPWAQPSGQTPRLPVRANFPIFLKHHGKGWRFEYLTIKGKGKAADKTIGAWLPNIQLEYERPGVNGIRTDGRNIDSTLRHANLNKEGYTTLSFHTKSTSLGSIQLKVVSFTRLNSLNWKILRASLSRPWTKKHGRNLEFN